MEDNKNKEIIDENLDNNDEEKIRIQAKNYKKFFSIRKKKNIAILVIVAIIAIVGLFYFNKHEAAKNNNPATSKIIDENSYNGSNIMRVDLSQIKKINIDLKTADLRIQKSTTNPYVEYTHLYRGDENQYTLDVSYEKGELKLKSNIVGKELNMKNKTQIVRIFLPSDKAIDEIKANIGAGDVKITDLEVRDLDLNVKSGNISFENSFFGGNVSNQAGDISLVKTELLNTKLATNVGDIIIEDGKLGPRSDFSTQTGNIIIKSTDSLDNYNVRASLDIGNFIFGNVSYRNIKDGFTKDNKVEKDIALKTKVGNIVFNKGEGAILEKEEYITNKPKKKEESKYDYINVEDDEENQDSNDYLTPSNNQGTN